MKKEKLQTTDSADTPRVQLDLLKPKNWLDIKARIQKIDKRKCFSITMDLRNGKTDRFIVEPVEKTFIYMRGVYIIDENVMYEDISQKMNALDYHQDLSLPYLKKINVKEIKEELIKCADDQIVSAMNPSSLYYFMKSQVIERVIMGGELDKALKVIKILALVCMIVGVLTFLILLKGSGILNSIHLPFG